MMESHKRMPAVMFMEAWFAKLKNDPIGPLLECGNAAVRFFAQRDLQGKDAGPIETVWDLPEAKKLLKKQQPDGSFGPVKKKAGAGEKYGLTETWRAFRCMVDQYGMDRAHPAAAKAAEYLFSCQTEEGDIRGMLGNQYAPYYTGAILYLLIKAGYAEDPRAEKGIRWLLSVRQDDGGWVIGSPGLANHTWREVLELTSDPDAAPVRDFDFSKPFSAAGTGMAIRALAVHPKYCRLDEAVQAGKLLKSKFFKKDNYSWYEHPDNWIRFQYPYWWNHLLSALDMLCRIGFKAEDADIENALEWLVEHQEESGLWKVSYSSIHKATENEKSAETAPWISLCICRILKNYCG
jgi:hypothetical protein